MLEDKQFGIDQKTKDLSPYFVLFSDSLPLVVRELALDIVQLSRSIHPNLGKTDFFVRNVQQILDCAIALPPEIYDGRQDLHKTLSGFAVQIVKAMESSDLSLNMQLRILQSYEETRSIRYSFL